MGRHIGTGFNRSGALSQMDAAMGPAPLVSLLRVVAGVMIKDDHGNTFMEIPLSVATEVIAAPVLAR